MQPFAKMKTRLTLAYTAGGGNIVTRGGFRDYRNQQTIFLFFLFNLNIQLNHFDIS